MSYCTVVVWMRDVPLCFQGNPSKTASFPAPTSTLSLLSRFILSEASFYSTDTLGVLAADTGKQKRSDMTSALKDHQRPVWPDQTKAGATRPLCPSVCCDWRPEQGSWNQTRLWNVLDAAATAEAPRIEVTQETRGWRWLGSRQWGISSFLLSFSPFFFYVCIFLGMHTPCTLVDLRGKLQMPVLGCPSSTCWFLRLLSLTCHFVLLTTLVGPQA